MYQEPLVHVAQSASSSFSRRLARGKGSASLTTSHGVKDRSSSSARGVACLLLANFAEANVQGGELDCCHHVRVAVLELRCCAGGSTPVSCADAPEALTLVSCSAFLQLTHSVNRGNLKPCLQSLLAIVPEFLLPDWLTGFCLVRKP